MREALELGDMKRNVLLICAIGFCILCLSAVSTHATIIVRELVKCPYCGNTFQADVYRTINFQMNPGLKEKADSGELDRVTCKKCGKVFNIHENLVLKDTLGAGRTKGALFDLGYAIGKKIPRLMFLTLLSLAVIFVPAAILIARRRR